MVVAHRHRAGANAGSDVEVRGGDDARLAAGLDQEARMAEPLDEVAAERRRRAPAARLDKRALSVEQLDQRRIAERLHQPPGQQEQKRRQSKKSPPSHHDSSMISVVKTRISVSGRSQASFGSPAFPHVCCRIFFMPQPYCVATCGSSTPRLAPFEI